MFLEKDKRNIGVIMNTEEKIKVITRNLEETLTEEELKQLLESNIPAKHYIGFEISGKVHLGTGLASMLKIKDSQDAGVKTTILLADWHTWLNKKLDGSLETAKRLAREYFEEGMKASALCVGADPEKIDFVLGSELYEKLGSDFWATVIKVSKATTLSRMIRSTTIMGRKEADIQDSAMLIYPALQAADIFALGVNIAHAGTDQRNVHVVARDVAKELGYPKPVAIHHHLLLGLTIPFGVKLEKDMGFSKEEMILSLKMSKSKPDSAVFIHDSPEEIERKIKSAYCPEGVVEYNPILDWTKYLIFYDKGSSLEIVREEKFGGNVTYNSYSDLEADFVAKKLHPVDLKQAVAKWLIKKLEPARKYFEDPLRQKALEEIEELTYS